MAAESAVIDLSNPDHSGYLMKRSAWLKEWRKRYFVLKGNMLHFAKDKHSQPHGSVCLSDCLTVKSAEQKIHKRNCFEITTPSSTFFMCSDTEKEKDEWIGAVGKAIVKYSGVFARAGAEDDEDDDEDSDEDSDEDE